MISAEVLKPNSGQIFRVQFSGKMSINMKEDKYEDFLVQFNYDFKTFSHIFKR